MIGMTIERASGFFDGLSFGGIMRYDRIIAIVS
jgi:hypothetical protein